MKRVMLMAGLAVLAALTISACGASNRLAEYDFRDRTIAVISNIPPYPDVETGDVVVFDEDHLLASIAHIGSAVAKEVQAHKARRRLDSAMQYVDVSDRIAGRVLERGASYLRARPVDDDREADFVLDVRVRAYGIEAESWDARSFFKIEADVLLFDADGRQVWKRRVKERDAITPTLLAGPTLGNIVSAEALSRLSVDEMVVAMEHLADFAADRMMHKLQHDLAAARD